MGYPVMQVAITNSGDWSRVWLDGELIHDDHECPNHIVNAIMQRIEGEIHSLEIDSELWYLAESTDWDELLDNLKEHPKDLWSLVKRNYGNEDGN